MTLLRFSGATFKACHGSRVRYIECKAPYSQENYESNRISRRWLSLLFFSREETRMHVHVYCGDGEGKFWLEPQIELARNYGLSRQQLKIVENIIEERQNGIRSAWQNYFKS